MWCCCWWPWRSFFIVITLISTTGSLVSSQPTLAEKHMAVHEDLISPPDNNKKSLPDPINCLQYHQKSGFIASIQEKLVETVFRELPDLIVSLEKAEERVHSFANQQHDEVTNRHLQYLHSELVQLKESFKGLKDEISMIPNGIKFNLLEHKRDEFKTKIDKVDELGVAVPFYIRRDNREIEDLLNGLGKFFTSLDNLVKERKKPFINRFFSDLKSIFGL